MTITTECPGCRKTLKVKDKFAGRTARCPSCSTTIAIPELEDDEIFDAEPAGEGGEHEDPYAVSTGVADKGSEPTDGPDDRARKECPACGESVLAVALICRYCRTPLDEDGNSAWRDGKVLVVNRDVPLPDVCIKTGEPSEMNKRVKLSWMPPSKQIFMILLIGALFAQMFAVKAEVDIPLTRAWNGRRKMKLALGIFGLIIGIVCMIAGPIAEAEESITAAIVIGGLVMLLGGLILAVSAGNIVSPKKITDSYVFLKGAKPAFLDTLPEWHGRE